MKVVLFFLTASIFCRLNSQTLQWFKQVSYNIDAYGQDVAVDSADNVYLAGHYAGYSNSDPGGMFLHKYSSSGNLLWRDSATVPNSFLFCGGVTLDQNQKPLLVSHTYSGQITFANKVHSGAQTVVTRYSTAGSVLNVMDFCSGMPRTVKIDSTQVMYIAGCGTFDTNGTILKGLAGYDLGYDANGDVYNLNDFNNAPYIRKFLKNAGMAWNTYVTNGWGRIAVDRAGNTYLTHNNVHGTSLLLKMDSTGTAVWTHTMQLAGSAIYYREPYLYLAGLKEQALKITHFGYVKLDLQGNVLNSFFLPDSIYPAWNINNITARNNNVYLAITEKSSPETAVVMKISEPAPGTTVSIAERDFESNSLIIAPNPVSKTLFYSYDSKSIGDHILIIRNLLGETLIQSKFMNGQSDKHHTVSIESLQAGIYVCEIKERNGVTSKKFVVSR